MNFLSTISHNPCIKKTGFTCKAFTLVIFLSILSGCDLMKDIFTNLDKACRQRYIEVNTTRQGNPNSFVFCTTGPCSIQDAIATAMASPLEICNGIDPREITVVLREGVTYTIESPVGYGDEENPEGGPTAFAHITKKLTIQGNGAIIKRGEGAPAFRFFYVGSGGELILDGVTLDNGGLEGSSGGSGESETTKGGAIFNKGILTLTNSTISETRSTHADGGDVDRGVVYNAAEGKTTILNSTLINNKGNAIVSLGDITIEKSSIENNDGTGIFLNTNSRDSQGIIRQCFIYGNKNSGIINRFAHYKEDIAEGEEAIDLESRARVIIENTTIAHNEANMGGGIFNNGLVEMNHVSLVFNRALSAGSSGSAGGGGGIYNHQTAWPSASYLMAKNSLIAQNTEGGSAGVDRSNCGSEDDWFRPATFTGINFISNSSCSNPSSASTLIIGNPMISTSLTGTTYGRGYTPITGSPLIDGATDCPSEDQRGNPRIGSSCNIGAIEVE